MANTTIQLKKSGSSSNAPTSLANGELAINYADGVLYYANATGSVKPFYSAVNSFGAVNANGTIVSALTRGDILSIVPGSGIGITGDAINEKITISYTGATGSAANIGNTPPSSGNTQGSLWWNSDLGKLFVYYIDANSAQWVEADAPIGGMDYTYVNTATAGANAWSNTKVSSVSGTAGQIYSSGGNTPSLNLVATGVTAATYGGATQIPYFTVDEYGRTTLAGNVAVNATGGANIGDTAPTSPQNGALWWSSTLGRLFVYYVDVDSSQWVDASPDTLATSTGLASKINGALQNTTGTFAGILTVAGGVNTTNLSTSTNVASIGSTISIAANGDIFIKGTLNML